MAGWGHVYVTAHGEFSAPWVGETAQIGARLLLRSAGFDNSPIVTIPDNGAVTTTFETDANTDFTISRTFDLDIPGTTRSWSELSDDVASDFRKFLVALQTDQASLFHWSHIKMAPIERGTGKYLAPASIWTLKSNVAGGGSGMQPPEVALCASLRTPIVGKRGRGRMYIPAMSQGSQTASAQGKVNVAAQTRIATALKTLVLDVSDLPGLDDMRADIVICSGNSTTAVVPREARVGDHFDAQRRRQHQVEETYVTQQI